MAPRRAGASGAGPNPEGRGVLLHTPLQVLFSIGHHVHCQPERTSDIMSGVRFGDTVFVAASVLAAALRILFVAGHGLALETAAGTWNSLWADRAPRIVVVAKLARIHGMVLRVAAIATGRPCLTGRLMSKHLAALAPGRAH
jgi:hypothetical protein